MIKYKAVIMILMIVFLSGCGAIFGQNPVSITFNGDMDASEDGFRMDGRIVVSSQREAPNMDDVTVQLYTESGSLIREKPVEPFQRGVPFELRSETVPKYVIIASPKIWEKDHIEVSYFVVEDPSEGKYRVKYVTSRDELPIDIES